MPDPRLSGITIRPVVDDSLAGLQARYQPQAPGLSDLANTLPPPDLSALAAYDPMTGAQIGGGYGEPTQAPSQQGMTLAEKYARHLLSGFTGAVTAPGRALTGELPMWAMDPTTGEINTSPEAMAAAGGMAGLSMTGGIGGTGQGGFALGAGPVGRGLSFPADEAATRLRLRYEREAKAIAKGEEVPGLPVNQRTVIPAPKPTYTASDINGKVLGEGFETAEIAKEAFPEGVVNATKQFPDFVAGRLTPEDWIARHEALLTPDEIHTAAKWYPEIFGEFMKHTNGDEALAQQYMRGWLVAQQNVDVPGSMQNMLLQREQILRGVPEARMKAAGMPMPTLAARRVMQDRPIEMGVGQKIADFVDSAEGKNIRSWMGNDPQGGSPFVVDVHTGRDMGLVDEKLKNHLRRLGYDDEALQNLTVDLKGSPTASQYENRAQFGRDLTDELNRRNWQGRSDWTPKEVQAIGWMGMTKLTADKAENILTGLAENMRHLSMEVSPGAGSPWEKQFGARLNALPPDKQYAITHQITQSAIDRVKQLSGVDVRDIVHATGGWQEKGVQSQNPSTVAQTFASPQGAEIAANALGHLLRQTEVWSNKVKPPTSKPKGFAVDFIGDGNHVLGTDAGLRDFWAKLTAADPTGYFQGYQPLRTPDGKIGIRALIDRGGVKTQTDLENALAGPIDKMLKELPGDYLIRHGEAEITKARNDWTVDKNGQGYTRRLVQLLGRNPTADLNHHGKELAQELRAALDAAEGGPGAKAGKARGPLKDLAKLKPP
jgi:hypothetical protein